jgi:hypothetical protein
MEKEDLRREFIEKLKKERDINIPEEYSLLRNQNYCEWLESQLIYSIQSRNGLWAIDFNPKELIKRFVDSQSDATRLVVEDVEDLIEDWSKWIDDENMGKNPFHQLMGA